jgi:hypothetical protein
MNIINDTVPPVEQHRPVENAAFRELVNLSKNPETDFKKIAEKFDQLVEHPNVYGHEPYIITDEKKGELFSKVLEIKAQHPERFVEEIKDCTFVRSETDGFIRKITINAPGEPVFEERVFIDKQSNGDMRVIFVQNHDEDFFACSNDVWLDGGKWHWMGTYLYGTPQTDEKMHHMFETTYANMLKFLDNQEEFNQVYNSLQK